MSAHAVTERYRRAKEIVFHNLRGQLDSVTEDEYDTLVDTEYLKLVQADAEEYRRQSGYDATVNINLPKPKSARDAAQYVRQQKGHSLVLHLLLGGFVLWIPAIYYSISPNHYWHA